MRRETRQAHGWPAPPETSGFSTAAAGSGQWRTSYFLSWPASNGPLGQINLNTLNSYNRSATQQPPDQVRTLIPSFKPVTLRATLGLPT